jgi:transketolase
MSATRISATCPRPDPSEPSQLADVARRLRGLVIETTHFAGMGHTGGSLSEADILTALFFRVMRHLDPANPRRAERDRFILSKGHATVGYYSALALRGYFPVATLATFDRLGSILQGHPDMHKTPGVDMSSGSLGQGLSCGIGMALASARLARAERPGGGFATFVLLGDGEVQEGQVWEAALFAGAQRVTRLVAIIDNNGVQLASRTADASSLEPLADKWRAFGWRTLEVDGHDVQALVETLEAAREQSERGPVAVVARTIKGKGVSFMEGSAAWHARAPNDEEFTRAMAELAVPAALAEELA